MRRLIVNILLALLLVAVFIAACWLVVYCSLGMPPL